MSTGKPGLMCELAMKTTVVVGVAFVAAAAAMQTGPGCGGPVCNKKIDMPTSQSHIQSGCTSWTECDEAWQCPTENPGVFTTCGTPSTSIRYCLTCVGGEWNSTNQRCELGVSGICDNPVEDDTYTVFLSPVVCP